MSDLDQCLRLTFVMSDLDQCLRLTFVMSDLDQCLPVSFAIKRHVPLKPETKSIAPTRSKNAKQGSVPLLTDIPWKSVLLMK